MAKKTDKATIRIQLTPEQREQIQRVLGKEVSELELTPEALEERVAPGLAGASAGMSCRCSAVNC